MNYWFVGASFGTQRVDQTERFHAEGIWQNGYRDKLLDVVRSMTVGDKIAIKAAYTRKRKLPFDNRGHTVSVMKIKAIGTITRNHGDGRHVDVAWEQNFQEREWYFYTGRTTVWRPDPATWEAQALIDFAFHGGIQDIDRFRNEPYWRERFGDTQDQTQNFVWTKFYTAMASALLRHKDDRSALIAHIHAMSSRFDCMVVLNDKSASGEQFPLQDICPYTTLALFNRGLTNDNRAAIAGELAAFLEVEEEVPNTFEGVPVVNNQRSWFFSYGVYRKEQDIDDLWNIFATSIALADGDGDEEERAAFIKDYDRVQQCRGVSWNITMGLFWTRPWDYVPLDTRSRAYLAGKLDEPKCHGQRRSRPCSGADYLSLIDRLTDKFSQETCPVHSFPEMSLAAWNSSQVSPGAEDEEEVDDASPEISPETASQQVASYTIEDILYDGCFIPQERLEQALGRLSARKNIILQGPPGTGKTWLAKRIAYAAMGCKDQSRLQAVQFHPNLSYEDFIRGYRPASDGRLQLVDGPFLQMMARAQADRQHIYALVIEEINRGNPAQIFGEMLTLLEHDKRCPDEALALSYQREPQERLYIPPNLLVIGTMNIADRSLALVDLALRRRFAFMDLEPCFDAPWQEWMLKYTPMPSTLIEDIAQRMLALNQSIAESTSLGPQYRIGHSYLTLGTKPSITDYHQWFRDVVTTEIAPLLEEYWFDNPATAHMQRQKLLEGWPE